MNPLIRWVSEAPSVVAISKEKNGVPAVYPVSVSPSAWPVFLCALRAKTGKQLIVLTPGEADARNLAETLQKEMNESISFLPSRDRFFFKSIAASGQLDQERIQCLESLGNRPPWVIASIENLLDRFQSPERFQEEQFPLETGDEIVLESVLSQLSQWGYERTDRVEGPAQFALRGGILDIFVPGLELPIRIELFDNEVDSIRYFQVDDQRSVENLTAVMLRPARELNLRLDQSTVLIQALEKEAVELKTAGNQEGLKTCMALLEGFRSNGTFDDLRKYAGYLPDYQYSFLDYCDPDGLIVLMGAQRCQEKLKFEYAEFLERYQLFLEQGEALPGQYQMLRTPESAELQLRSRPCVHGLGVSDSIGGERGKPIPVLKEAPSYYGKLEELAQDTKRWQQRGFRVVLFTGAVDRVSKIRSELEQEGITFISESPDVWESGQCVLLPGHWDTGFRFDEQKLIVLTEKELYGIRKRSKKKKGTGRVIESFNDLQVGDMVVHEHHGIGRYLGVDQLTVEGLKKDYLKIQYHGEDFLYIPIEQMELIHKYIGSEGAAPKLSRLGGVDWSKAKSKTRKSIEDMTEELLKLYAERHRTGGYPFSPDTPWQVQFEDHFPYEETPDQLRCIQEIKTDMEREGAMDRLLCGDVGFGKTEVALRAVFKAAMDSKQTAFLVPTTILAQQHFNTMTERFQGFPIRVEMMSRFKTKKEQDAILRDLKSGLVDVLVGTHRLLSKDIAFKNLGLLIVDEEQRFGVKHKERIKQFKTDVDVLTLTATPIPRTLHMSLSGIRDMSVIEDPPEDRYPIQTYVTEEDPLMIREAVLKEVERGGQVYFVHNRVADIEQITAGLGQRMPQVRFRYAHGQMQEHQLEVIMNDFYHHEFDVLVATTIIETGLDIPNVNTIIINDADQLGLSQLYQLRGRVGRSNRLAYAYLIYPRNKVLSEIAEKRLRAVKELVELGSGFKIAMKDLEIRGAGNLLGGEQHGHMVTVGYDMYCKMLEETVLTLKGTPVEPVVETTVELPADAHIPDGYIPEDRHKMEAYRKIAAIHSREDYYRVQEEFEDRFGTIPQPMDTLMNIALIKALAQAMKFVTVTEDVRSFYLHYSTPADIQPVFIAQVLEKVGNRVQFNAGAKPHFSIKKEKSMVRDRLLKSLLQTLEEFMSFQSAEN